MVTLSGEKLGSAQLIGAAAALIVAVGGHHHDHQIRKALFDLAQQLQPVNARHVDLRQDRDQSRFDAAGELAQCVLTRIGEVHRVRPLPHLAAETLAIQLGHATLRME